MLARSYAEARKRRQISRPLNNVHPMSNRFIRKTADALRSLRRSPAAHPVEMAIALHACVVICVLETSEIYISEIAAWMRPMCLSPIFIVTAYCLNAIFVRGAARTIYYLWWLPYAATAFVPGVVAWSHTSAYVVTNIALLPLLLIAFRLQRDNERFVDEAAHTALAAVTGIAFAAVIQLLFWLIYISIVYIFDLHEIRHMGVYSSAVSFVVLAPAIFFAVKDNTRLGADAASRTGDMLLNFIITPALLIYNVILYIYTAKILLTWSLPKGGIANMIFAFTMTAVAVKALQQFVARRLYDRYFDHFSIIAAPLVILFWVGSLRRVAEYGLTEWRFYMILCGIIMTVCIALFLSRRTGRYIAVALTAFALFFCSAYIPPLKAENVAMRSQIRRARNAANKLGILGEDGALRLGSRAESDSVQRDLHRRLYQSLDYIDDIDTLRLAREFGLRRSKDYLASLSPQTESYVLRRSEAVTTITETFDYMYVHYDNYSTQKQSAVPLSTNGYGRIIAKAIDFERRSAADGETPAIEIDGHRIDPDALLDTMLSQSGFSRANMPAEEWLDRHSHEFLTCKSDSIIIVFERMQLVNDNGKWIIMSANDLFTVIK